MKSSSKRASSSNDVPPGFGGLIGIPTINDVLSGRGGRINMHPGNIYYRRLVTNCKHSYVDKNTKILDKAKIADRIVTMVRKNNGRFLKEDAKSKYWKEIGDAKARKKAGQAMRENATKSRRELEEGKVAPLVIDSAVDAPKIVSVPSPEPNSSAHATLYDASTPLPFNPHSGDYVQDRHEFDEVSASHPDRFHCGHPQVREIPYDSNKFKNGAAKKNYAAYAHIIEPIPLYLPNQQLDTAIQQPPYQPYSDIVKEDHPTILKDEPSSSTQEQCRSIPGAIGLIGRNFSSSNSSDSTITTEVSLFSNLNNKLGTRGQFRDADRGRSYLPSQLTDPLIGSMRDMSLDEKAFRDYFKNSDQDLDNSDLSVADESMLAELNTSSSGNIYFSPSDINSNRRERLKSDTSLDVMSFQIGKGKSENSSSDIMSLESKISVTSAWLSGFKGMHGLPPGGDLRERFSSENSTWSIFSEISADM